MKPILMATLIAIASVIANAEASSVAGEWQIERSAVGNASKQTCTFTQQGSELAGNCTASAGTASLTGKVDGKTITWTYKSDSQGGPVTVVYNGTLDSDSQMTGTVTAVEFSIQGEFTATRAK